MIRRRYLYHNPGTVTISMPTLRDLFLLDSDVIFLNHGSFGATPRPVFNAYQEWQRRLERQPVRFMGRELDGHLLAARQALGAFVHAGADDLVFITNATVGVNIVARSLMSMLKPGDEILATNHEYGACSNAWEYVCAKTGARYVRHALPLPDEAHSDLPDADGLGLQADGSAAWLAEAFWQGVTPATKVIYLSHITSPTAQRLPVEEICARARDAGILTVVDGAHAPGQIDLDMTAIGADFYSGNCHKWLCAPKGAGFLFARPEVQRLVEPLIVSWGWGPERGHHGASDYLDMLQWQGTNDYAAFLAVPAAIDFQTQHNWTAVRADCARLLQKTLLRLADLLNQQIVYWPHGVDADVASGQPLPWSATLPPQLAVAALPAEIDQVALKAQLYDEDRIEIPVVRWRGRAFLRISVQGYTTEADLDTLVDAVARKCAV